MDFDRARVKEEAKARIKLARPQPWRVSGAYWGLALLLPLLLWLFLLLAVSLPLSPLYRLTASPAALTVFMLFSYLVLLVPMALLQPGYIFYSMKVWRREPAGYRDLLKGVSSPAKVLALWGLLLLLSLLWCLLLFVPMFLSLLLSRTGLDPALWEILTLFLILGTYGFLFSRILLYLLSFHVLLDRPDCTARQALRESKALMLGRRWQLILFFLSFTGWYLLECLIIYAAALMGTGIFFFSLRTAATQQATALLLVFLTLFPLCAVLPLLLHLTPYIHVSLSGIYDILQGRPLIPPQPPQQTHPTA